MGYTQFLIWAGKQGFKYGQRYLYKAWKEAEKLGKPIVENQFPKLLNKAKDYYKNFKTFDPKVVPKPTPDKVTKIPTKFKTRPVESKPPLQLSEKNRLGQEAFQFFGTLGKNNPFKGRDGPRRLADWMYDLKPAEVMKVMKDYGYKPKIIPKAQGGIMTVSDPGMGEGPFMMEEFLEAVKQGFKGTYDDYIDQIDRSPRDYLADGGPSQKDIDKGIAAIEKLKSSLMPESYEALIEIYKDKQKDLNIEIMESAGGLGEMLGEGGRAGFDTGGSSIRKYTIPPKVWPLVVEMYEKAGGRGETGMSLKEFAFQYFNKAKGGRVGFSKGNGKFKSNGHGKNFEVGYPGTIPINPTTGKSMISDTGVISGIGAAIAAPFLLWYVKKKKKEANQKAYDAGEDLPYPFTGSGPEEKAEGGRIGMMYGGDPGFAFSYGGSWADWKDNHASEMPLMDYINQKLPKARHPFSDTKYNSGGPVHDLDGLIQMYMEEGLSHEEAVQAAQATSGLDMDISKKAEGGRIGMQEGGEPPKIGHLIIDFIVEHGRQPKPSEVLQLEEKIRIESKAEGGRIGFKKGGKGGIGDLLGEMYRLFEIGPLLGSPELIDLIQKIPFEKGGRVGFKKGGGPKMSRRSFLQLMGGLASLPIVGKYFKLAKTKPVQDFSVKLKTYFHNSDVDYGTTGNAFFDLSALTAPVKRALYGIMKNLPANKVGGKSGIPKDYNSISPGDAKHVIKKLQDQGFKGKLTGIVDEAGDVLKQAEKANQKNFVKTYKKQSMKQNVKDHKQYNDYVVYENDPGFMNWKPKAPDWKPFKSTIDEVAEMLEPIVKKGEGGRIGAADGRFIDSVGIGPLNINPRFSITESEKGIGPEVDLKTGTTDIGADIMLDLPKDFYLKGEYDKGRASEDIYYQGKKVVEDVPFDDDIFKFGAGIEKEGFRAEVIYNPENERYEFKLVKSFNDGGKVWQPKSAPKLTTTIPPERGPTPQGLTYLTGDDIVQNIG